MKAIVYHPNGHSSGFKYEDVTEPSCRAGEVVIEVKSIVIDTRDLHTGRTLANSTPLVPGTQFSGVVVDVGKDVSGRSVGDRVVAISSHGSHAEFAVAEASNIWDIPSQMDFDTAASVPFSWGAAHECISEFGNVSPGDIVLVHTALEAFGLAAVQLAKRAAARVVATSPTMEGLHTFLKQGADIGIHLGRQEFVTEIYKMTAGRGAKIVVECMTGTPTPTVIGALGYRGQLVTVGTSRHEHAKPIATVLCRGNRRIQGLLFESSLKMERLRVHAAVANLLADISEGRLFVPPMKRFPLEDAAEAHIFAAQNAAFGTVVLQPGK